MVSANELISFLPAHSRFSSFLPLDRNSRILVTDDSTAAVLLATRPTRDRKCLRALYVRVRDWVVPTVKKMLLRDDLHSEPPPGARGEF